MKEHTRKLLDKPIDAIEAAADGGLSLPRQFCAIPTKQETHCLRKLSRVL